MAVFAAQDLKINMYFTQRKRSKKCCHTFLMVLVTNLGKEIQKNTHNHCDSTQYVFKKCHNADRSISSQKLINTKRLVVIKKLAHQSTPAAIKAQSMTGSTK